ncbi:MAG TPA: sugar ABC transporter substrate-binding protein [Geminicoccaceae bacterium]|nr:sugar ABC transporter substrate-binding protein [Geminicoccus sp.]HMU49331.1 sugar ABC transporter substrate-binding protein [Geminicoccaceae bacterium]
MKKWAMLLGAAALGLVMAAQAQAQQQIRIVMVTHGQAASGFWSVAKKGADDADADLADTVVEYRAPETYDMVAMAQLIDAAVASKPDGLAVSIPDPDALGPSIQAAIAAGIPVISLNSGVEVAKQLGVQVHVGQTELIAGIGGGESMKARGVTKAACVNQEVGNVALDLRCQGFAQGLGTDVDVIATTIDPTEVKNAVTAYLTRNPDTQALFILGSDPAMPAVEAVEGMGLIGKVKLATFDLSEGILQSVRDGKMEFAIDQQQYLQGYLPVVLLRLYKKFGLMPGADVLTGPGLVTKENAASVIDWSAKGYR